MAEVPVLDAGGAPLVGRRAAAVADAGAVAEQVPNRDGPRGVDDFVASAVFGHGDGRGGVFRKEVGHRLADQQRAALLQHHRRRADDRLGHGGDAEDGVLPYGRVRLSVSMADGPVVDRATVVGDLQDGARQLFLGHRGVEEVVQSGKTFRRDLGGDRCGEC